jgi:ATP-dependent protease ClpP protease subunit
MTAEEAIKFGIVDKVVDRRGQEETKSDKAA